MSCATAKKEGSSRYASSIRARSTRLAGSVRERAIAPNAAKSFSPMANSIACRHAVMSATLSANQSRKARTHVGKCESSTYDRFHGIDVLVAAGFDTLDKQADVLSLPRSTTWSVLHGSRKKSGLSASLLRRMLKSPRLPPSVRVKIIE